MAEPSDEHQALDGDHHGDQVIASVFFRDGKGYTNVTDHEPIAQFRIGTCERCGEYREGRSQLMIYRLLERFPASPVARQFFCSRCLRVMRIYAFIGLSLLTIIVGSLIVAVLWIRFGLNT